MEGNQCSAGNEETVQTEYTEVECLYYRESWPSRIRGEKKKKKKGKEVQSVDAEERNGPAYFMQNRPHVRLEARVQHVLSSPIAPVGVVPWKPLVCAFHTVSYTYREKEEEGREGGRKRREPSIGASKSRCIAERERTLRGSPRESFFPERVGGVLCYVYI